MLNWKQGIPVALVGCMFAAATPIHANITALNEGTHDWGGAGWTDGVPVAGTTVFLNGTSKVRVTAATGPALAEGLRIGNAVPPITSLEIEAASLECGFIVLGDAPDSNAVLTQTGGSLWVLGMHGLGMELGNPHNLPTKRSASLATFAGGDAKLGHLRFNCSQHRQLRMIVFGVMPVLRADSLTFTAKASGDAVQPGNLSFILSDAGVAPLRISGDAHLGDGDLALLEVDASRYTGGPIELLLLSAGRLHGRFADSKVTSLPDGMKAEIKVTETDVVLHLRQPQATE